MTTGQLNNAIRKLADNREKMTDQERKAEFLRLYRADASMKSLTARSMRIMLRLNTCYLFEPLHMFGIYIEDVKGL